MVLRLQMTRGKGKQTQELEDRNKIPERKDRRTNYVSEMQHTEWQQPLRRSERLMWKIRSQPATSVGWIASAVMKNK